MMPISEFVENFCVVGTKKENSIYEDITIVFTASDKFGEEDMDKVRNLVNDINKTLPVFKKVTKIIYSKVPLPMANGIKIKRLALKDMIVNNPDDYVTL